MHRQLTAATQRIAIDCRDDWLAAMGDGLPITFDMALVNLQHRSLDQFAEVCPGGKHRVTTGEDDDPRVGAIIQALKVPGQLLAQCHIQCIE
ncbi:hypothetical protein D9M68_687140 [compost metagenome]